MKELTVELDSAYAEIESHADLIAELRLLRRQAVTEGRYSTAETLAATIDALKDGRGMPATITGESERQFQQSVIGAARLLGWKVAHFRTARTSSGWRTPVAADGAGFPDLCCVHEDHGVLFAELKSAGGKVSTEQAGWVGVLTAAGAAVYVWRPDDWDRIVEVLRGDK